MVHYKHLENCEEEEPPFNRKRLLIQDEAAIAIQVVEEKTTKKQEATQIISIIFHLDKGKFAEASTALYVSDGNLPVVFNPPPSTEDVVYTGGNFIPFVLITKPRKPE